MVIFSCLIVTLILYFLQSDGIIYVVIIAVVAELFNLFMSQTMTATVKNQSQKKYGKIINSHAAKINELTKTIKQLKKIRDDAIHKLYKANQTIKKYEEQLGIEKTQAVEIPQKDLKKVPTPQPAEQAIETEKPEKAKIIDHLPDGSNRKELPI